MALIYNGSPEPTLGVECELLLLDPKTWQPVNRVPELLAILGDVGWAKPELLRCIVEVITTPCRTVADVKTELVDKFCKVEAAANQLGLTTCFMATHPTAMWHDMAITDNQRYMTLVNKMQWPARRAMIMGLHVHVGIKNAEKAIAIFNAMTTFLPHLLALSAASPYFMGEETGLASCRIKVFEAMPTAGLPQRMLNWAEFQRFMKTLIHSGAIQSIQEIWWDVRPHPKFGTIEIRICDGTPDLDDVLALVAMAQCLICYLEDLYDNGEQLPIHKYWFIKENKWRATRWGLDADIVHTDDGTTRHMRDDLHLLVNALTPSAIQQNCLDELKHVEIITDRGGSYERQRAVYRKTESFQAVTESMVTEFHDSIKRT
ncbi:MAG: glutamate--cysteine ligase [Calditrichaeota bacterium]|nr:glutamate--cysteine ligase [Calditrichota bacterium]MCB9368961.1 glutamate--cysteine ligase [Calditrichota bacterium]